MKISFGTDFRDSIVEIDGEKTNAHSARISIEGRGYTQVEVERVVHDSEGSYIEVIRKRLERPVEVEIEVPDAVKHRSHPPL